MGWRKVFKDRMRWIEMWEKMEDIGKVKGLVISGVDTNNEEIWDVSGIQQLYLVLSFIIFFMV